MDPHILDISLFLFYAAAIVGLGLAIGNAVPATRRTQRVRSRKRTAR